MSLDAGDLINRMLHAGASAFGANWSRVQGFAEQEFKLLAQRIVDIEAQIGQGLDPRIASHLFAMQKNTAVMVLAGLTTLTVLAVEAAVNAVLAVLGETVNRALGFALF